MLRPVLVVCLSFTVGLVGCVPEPLAILPDAGNAADAGGTDAGTQTPPPPQGLPVLGNGKHGSSSVQVMLLVGADSGLSRPRDLAFNPARPDQLWIVNEVGDSMVIVSQTGTDAQTAVKKSGPGSSHFMPRPAALAFGATNRMATVHDIAVPTQSTTPADFMGPSLWPTDSTFEGGHASHQDMLHNSPSATGIAWERDNVYWVFDGYHKSLTRYDFNMDHGPGGEDHSDGDIRRCVEGEVGYQPQVSSHLELDRVSRLLYIADTANHRIAVLDTTTGTPGVSLSPNYDGAVQLRVNGSKLTKLVGAPDVALDKPSGLALRSNVLYVTDNQTSIIWAFDLTGKVIDWLDLSDQVPAGGLMGIDLDAEGRIYVVSTAQNRVLRISPR